MIRILLLIVVLGYCKISYAAGEKPYITTKNVTGSFALAAAGKPVNIYGSNDDYPGVIRAMKDLQNDLGSVTGNQPAFSTTAPSGTCVLIGTVGKSSLIDDLVKKHKLDVRDITGKWENFIIQTVQNPLPGVSSALVIAGSDKRGTIFGIYDLSAQIGVSPWYWWADVPVKKQADLYVLRGRYTQGTPAVKYRGIFINDEAPAFSGWTKEKFGGVNHLAYEKVFELILRLKGNYLWPAMWANAFNDDDKTDPALADEYGIVMGTSHHEPMDRAQQEWKRYGTGPWDYEKNADVLKAFWKKGIENMGNKETLVTIAMRGDGDMAMTEGSNVALLEKIVKDQRQIIADVTGKPAEKTPQIWALYKEVQDYYDKGMRVPDDVTLLLCDDNWGNIRKLPKLGDPKRAGGYGIYYHFDYVGGPRNYKWLNTNPIAKTWEQMHLAHEYGANQVWIVNVGDLKPMEFPISFFLDYAWNPDRIPAGGLDKYTRDWAAQQFGPEHAAEIASILSKYTKYNGRRKPEMLNENTYSLTNYREFENVAADYNNLEQEAEHLWEKMPAEYKDAYFELVLHPVKACANLNQMYYTIARNRFYAQQGRAATNTTAAEAKALFAKDAEISSYYNHTLANGKWDHMMDQTHIGYTYWQQPPVDKMPEVKQIDLPATADMGVYAESNAVLATDQALPVFYPVKNGSYYIDVFNKGKEPFTYTVSAEPFINITNVAGKVDEQKRLMVSIDWAKAPAGRHEYPVTIKGAGKEATVKVVIENIPFAGSGFVETNGYVSMEAIHYTRAVNGNNIKWEVLPDHGRTLSAITTFPVTVPVQTLTEATPHLEYQVNLSRSGEIKLITYVSPSLDYNAAGGLKYAVSIDGEAPQVINLQADNTERQWGINAGNNANIQSSVHQITKVGVHTVKYWMISPGVVLQKLVLDCGGLKPSYLGPPESARK
ncbi:glycosyl hydrolase [Mucilaginibacter sp. PPCGB 2223]|nr:glycosyl hydrolase [Mucilaginibacter sp. PPCGB 2223]